MEMTGASLCYLSSSNQQIMRVPLPWRLSGVVGVAFMLMSLLALAKAMQVVAAIFLFLTMLMLMWVLLPYAGAYLKLHRRI